MRFRSPLLLCKLYNWMLSRWEGGIERDSDFLLPGLECHFLWMIDGEVAPWKRKQMNVYRVLPRSWLGPTKKIKTVRENRCCVLGKCHAWVPGEGGRSKGDYTAKNTVARCQRGWALGLGCQRTGKERNWRNKSGTPYQEVQNLGL